MNTKHIQFFSEDTNYRISGKRPIRRWIDETVRNEGKSTGDINIIVCSDDYLYKMNLEYLKHDTFTDIITFDYSEGSVVSGDIFISIQRVKENAKRFSVKTADEFHRVIVHGILHLCGYKDKTTAEKELMRQKENFYLSLRPDGLGDPE